MARIWSNGFETNNLVTNVESGTVSGSPTISSTIHNGGLYSMQCSSLASGTAKGLNYQFAFAGAADYYYKADLYIHTLPSADNQILQLSGSGTITQTTAANLRLTSAGLLKWGLGASQVGVSSSALSLDAWHTIQIRANGVPASGSRIIEIKIDNGSWLNITNSTHTTGAFFVVGANTAGEAQTQGEWYWDNLSVGDTTGSFQTGHFPWNDQIWGIPITGAGDANTFATQTGGTAGSANNYTRINEVSPDDATTFNGQVGSIANRLTADLFAVTVPSGIGSSDTINAAMVSLRHANSAATANGRIEALLESASAGTLIQGNQLISNSTTWRTAQSTNPYNPNIISYQTPASVAWTKATLVTSQVGYRVENTSNTTNEVRVSTVIYQVAVSPAPVNTNVVPGVATLATATFAPTVSVSNNQLVVPDPKALATATFAPVVIATNNVTVVPGLATLTTTAFAPTVTASDNKTVIPGLATLTLTTYAPVVTATSGQTVIPNTATLAISTFAPAISITDNKTVVPSTASLALSTFAPTIAISANQTVIPDTTALTTTLFAPTVSVTANQIVIPSTASLTLTTFTPTISLTANQLVVPSTASLTLTAFAPAITITANQLVIPDTLALVITGLSPSVSVGNNIVVTPGTASLALTTFAPTVSLSDNKTAVPGIAALITAAFAPTVTASDHKTVVPSTAALTTSTFAPIASIGYRIIPDTASLTTSTFVPDIIVGTGVTVVPGAATLNLTTYAPKVTKSGPSRKFYIDGFGNVYWVVNQDLGLLEPV